MATCLNCKSDLISEADYCQDCWFNLAHKYIDNREYYEYLKKVFGRLEQQIKVIESFQDKDTMYEGHINMTKYTLPVLHVIKDG